VPTLLPGDQTTGSPATTVTSGVAGGFSESSTTVPRRGGPEDGGPPRPRALGGVSGGGARNVVGAAVTAGSTSLLLFGRIAPFSGLIGFCVVFYVLFVVGYAVLVAISDDRHVVIDRLVTIVLYSAAAVLLTALVFIIAYTFWRGRSAVFFHSNFFTSDLRKAGPRQPLSVGGIQHAIVGTLWMIGIAVVITVPLGLTAAVYLNEANGGFVRLVRTIVEAMTALPSIIAGLFIFATWILIFHQQKAAFAGSLAISVDMLPIIIRSADVILRLVPGNLREASAALGAPSWRSVWHVVLPTARSGLATSVILGMARGIGETAPILLTVGYTKALNTDPLHGPMVSLPLAAFELVRSGEPNLQARGFAAAAFLLLLVLTLFVTARVIGGRAPGNLSKRQAQRSQRASVRIANRMITRISSEGDTRRQPAPRPASSKEGGVA
jgi:phosphate transport system permease protein